MARSTKVISLFLISLLFVSPYTATAAEPKDVTKVIKLIRKASTDTAKPSYHLSYMGMDYTIYLTLKDGKTEKVEVVAETFYGSKEDFKTYIITDENLDGVADSAIYKQGGKVKGSFDKNTETGKNIRTDSQSLYDSAVRFALRRLDKK